MHRQYLFVYACLAPRELLRFVDDHTSGEDIALNCLVSAVTGPHSPRLAFIFLTRTGLPPIYVANRAADYGVDETGALSSREQHVSTRDDAVQLCATSLGHMPLVASSVMAAAFVEHVPRHERHPALQYVVPLEKR